MKIERVQLIYFSAARTTRTVGQAAAKGTGLPMEEWDCTPQRAKAPFQPDERTLTILAVPSFGGRVPAPVAKRLEQLKGCGPAVLLSVYGARASEDTLAELYDLAERAGYRPIAAGEFVARHSMATRIAAERPNGADLSQAAALGKQAVELAQNLLPGQEPGLELPGNRPYRELAGYPSTRRRIENVWNAAAVPTSARWRQFLPGSQTGPTARCASPVCAAWQCAP